MALSLRFAVVAVLLMLSACATGVPRSCSGERYQVNAERGAGENPQKPATLVQPEGEQNVK